MTDFRALCAELVDDLEMADWPWKLKESFRADIQRARAALAEQDGPASVEDQLKRQLLNKTKADLIREVIKRALRDTASVHWRVADNGEQLVRVGDLLRWAEQTASEMEKTDDN